MECDDIVKIPLDRIDVGERRRRDFGDIAALAKGIKRVGLLQPILVDRKGNGRFRLIFGERRLRAHRMLKLPTIRAMLREQLTEDEYRDIELEENQNRKALLAGERSFVFAKRVVERAKKAEQVLGDCPKTPRPKGGRPTKGVAPKEEIANAIGVSRRSLQEAEQHLETAEEFPWMQGNTWKQSDVLRVRERLEEAPPEARPQIAAVLNTATILDPVLTVTLVENLTAKTPAERLEIYNLSQSTDPRERSLALTKAAELPPMPDPRLGILDRTITSLNYAIKPFPNDPLTPTLVNIREQISRARAAVKEVSFDARRDQRQEAIQ
jgi:ParB-like chromosome segregation protein Spo0J